jgi:predicted nucleotidyltransferase
MRRLTAEELQEKLATIIKQISAYNPQRVILFGSFARGDHHAMSDADLLIVKETDTPFLDRIAEVLSMCDYDIPVEPLVYTPRELEQMQREGNSFVEAVLREGIVVYEQQ